jgi:fermentation-respiration switch protein FrsA (DUF1100 family)
MRREDVEFAVEGVRCAAWFYAPDGPAPYATVVMAHGFSGTRVMRLDAYAERFAQAGLAALVFDYRHFGDSGGEPRQLLDINRQLTDWRAALAFVRKRSDVDATRLALWGTSFSGGHVLRIASEDEGVAACVSQVPFVSGWATARAAGVAQAMRMGWCALRDLVRHLFGRAPYYVPAIGATGSLAAITVPDPAKVEAQLVPPGTAYVNQVAARIMTSLLAYRPSRDNELLRCPLLFCVADQDTVVPAAPALALAARVPRAEVRRYPLDHFDIYADEPFERAVGDQIDFLRRHLLVHAGEDQEAP